MGNSKSQGATKRACGGTRKPREGTDLDELERRSKPLLEFLEANCNPNCIALVGREGATILEAVAFVPARGHTHGDAKTCELVAELAKREGVEVSKVAPYAELAVKAEGPAIVLVVTD